MADFNEAANALEKAAAYIERGVEQLRVLADAAEQAAEQPAEAGVFPDKLRIPNPINTGGADAALIVLVGGGVDRAALVRRLTRANVGGPLAFYSVASGRKVRA